MRRDICHYYEADLQSVYNAYAKVAREKFGKDCEYHNGYKLSFALNFTFRYNMNGGACTIHFMPCQSGTAVNVRYSIAQLFGARYEAYDEELTKNVVEILPVRNAIINSDPEQFEKYAEGRSANPQAASAPAPTAPAPTAATFTAPATKSAGTLSDLRRYKELLDEGLITQEEFEQKKKQILDLYV